MKKIILPFLLLYSSLLHADPWEDLTLEQALEVSDFLGENPYILDYCDCCDHDGEYATKVFLLEVTFVEIIPCSWDSDYYSVEASVSYLAELPYQAQGPDISAPLLVQSEDALIVSLNYTWGYNAAFDQAGPLYTIMPSDRHEERPLDTGYCKGLTAFPDPSLIKDSKYKKWYNSKS